MNAMTDVEHEMWQVSEITAETVILSRGEHDESIPVPRELLPEPCEKGDRYRLVEGFARAS